MRINPSFVFAHDNLANSCFELGRFSEATVSYRDALQYKPDYPEARNDLARLHLEPRFDGCDIEQAFLHHRDALVPLAELRCQCLDKIVTSQPSAGARADSRPETSISF